MALSATSETAVLIYIGLFGRMMQKAERKSIDCTYVKQIQSALKLVNTL
jgi:hypothetical protein